MYDMRKTCGAVGDISLSLSSKELANLELLGRLDSEILHSTGSCCYVGSSGPPASVPGFGHWVLIGDGGLRLVKAGNRTVWNRFLSYALTIV